IWTLVCMVAAIGGIRRGNVPVHRGFMIGSYLGTLMAFAFAALVPARLIPQLLNSRPLIAVVTVAAVGAVAAIFHFANVRLPARAPGLLIPRLRNGGPLIAVGTVAAVGAVAAIFHLATVRVTAAGKPRRPAMVVVRDQSIGRVTS